MPFESQNTDPLVCHCLGIAESEIRAAADFGDCESVADVKELTEAGSGCTSCHRRIIGLLQQSRRQAGSTPTSSAQSAAGKGCSPRFTTG